MDESRFRCTLVSPDGVSRRVGAAGIVIGRDPTCDVVLTDPSVSRRHALIRTSSEGVELVSLGRTAVEQNGKPVEKSQLLSDGDSIKVNELTFTVRVELPRPGRSSTTYRLVRGRSSYGISHTPFVVGGADTDDLILDGWPASALRFHLAQGELFVEVIAGSATKNGEPIELDTLEELTVGDSLGFQGSSFEIARGQDIAQTTITGDAHSLPSRVVIEMLPRGGRVVFSMPSGDHTVYLADRRLDLIAALVRPPSGYVAGDFIPDDVLRPIVWPRNPNVIRSEINVHLTRCRKDLLAAGLAGPRLLQRSPGGGATRLALAPGCTIEFI
ncbi:MAG TPA: FHA domain-containing protein [Kofleriaceae bacterium]